MKQPTPVNKVPPHGDALKCAAKILGDRFPIDFATPADMTDLLNKMK